MGLHGAPPDPQLSPSAHPSAGLHVGGHPDQPGGDQAEPQGVPGKALRAELGHLHPPRVSLLFLTGSDCIPCPRSTSNTCAPRTPRGPASCGWCGKATSPGPSPAASTPGASSASPQHKGLGEWNSPHRTPPAFCTTHACAQPLDPLLSELGPEGGTGLSLSSLLPAPSPLQGHMGQCRALPPACSGKLLLQGSNKLPAAGEQGEDALLKSTGGLARGSHLFLWS